MTGTWIGECVDLLDALPSGEEIDERAMGTVARLMRSHGLSPVLADVVDDPTASEPMRLRALGRSLVALRSVCPAPSGTTGNRCRAIRAASVA